MQVYVVGGAVRDALLGLPVHDRDYVVVGATPSEMVAQGFLPVGRDFPVFLHPVSHEEYALARTAPPTTYTCIPHPATHPALQNIISDWFIKTIDRQRLPQTQLSVRKCR